MPNIKSQKDRVIQTKKETARNKAVKSNLRSTIKKANKEIDKGDVSHVSAAVSTIDKAGAKGIMHKNTTARRVSAMMKRANAAAK